MSFQVKNHKNENIQILRFFAAFLVLLTHITFYIHERVDSNVSVWRNGEMGVPIFFVISGFVMHYTTNGYALTRGYAYEFLSKRVARVIPLYWLITTAKIAIAIAIPGAVLHNFPTVATALGSYVLFPMFNAANEIRPIHGVGWTLLHEMFFYYIFAIALLLRRSPIVFVSVVIFSLWVLGVYFKPTTALLLVVTNQINLMFLAGMFLSYTYRKGYKFSKVFVLTLLVVCIVSIFSEDFVKVKNSIIGSFPLEAVLIVFSLLFCDFIKFPSIRLFLNRLGDSSYSLYLIHPIVAPAICLALFKMHISNIWIAISLTSMFSVLCSMSVYKYIEIPLESIAKNALRIK